MKKTIVLSMILLLILLSAIPAYADVGDMGYFGGISDGRRLPKTTESLLSESGRGGRSAAVNFLYKEIVFLTGVPMVFDGILSVQASGGVSDSAEYGSYTETYRVSSPNNIPDPEPKIERNIVFNVNWRRVGQQIIKDYAVRSWVETINAGGAEFIIDVSRSYFGISILEDHPAAVTYYRGDISQRAVYTTGSGETVSSATLEAAGSFYGYNSAWSNTETHRFDYMLYTDQWQMQYQIRPSVSVNKMLQYTSNEPTAISFPGNYREVMVNDSGLSYDIFVKPQIFLDMPNYGSVNIPVSNAFEQLIAPNLSFLRGHPAESDITKLFAMEVLEGETYFYRPEEAITRGQFVSALVRAIKLPVEQPAGTRSRNPATPITFPDVPESSPQYPFIMAAYKAGIAAGRSNGYFFTDSTIERQEALVMMLRALGLENLGYDPVPVTAFTDDNDIDAWAKRELYAAERLGLIASDENGAISPKALVSKAEAAALLNRFIEYMRLELKTDYADHIVNFPN